MSSDELRACVWCAGRNSYPADVKEAAVELADAIVAFVNTHSDHPISRLGRLVDAKPDPAQSPEGERVLRWICQYNAKRRGV